MIGDRIFRDAPALLLLIFMTDYLVRAPGPGRHRAVFVPKLLIMFVDPIVGTLSDRLANALGRPRAADVRRRSDRQRQHRSVLPRAAFRHCSLAQAAYMSAIVFAGFTGYSLYSVPLPHHGR